MHAKAAEAKAKVSAAQAELRQAVHAENLLATVEAWNRVGEDGRLRDLDRWVDALAGRIGTDPRSRVAGDAVRALADCLGGDAGDRLRIWRSLLADPSSLARWIENIAAGWKSDLDWLYSLRNTALHDGRFESSTATLDVHSGRALVDLTLELLGNWHEQVARVGLVEKTSIAVIEELGSRQQDVLASLDRGTLTGLNVNHLTSPTSTGLDRV
ncbi:hypothetical protein [Nocardia nova]|uniref:hypothetical protein n=1 Tax=Nocardia nova TaxID=37330 RepID=UPI001893DC60|nr:hypothetical protein [Nocardia nova]MBF6150377.1 hypothetical protein [Nocardia nova]